jgi:uncharacterized short protein YbdD (DUF466 family)
MMNMAAFAKKARATVNVIFSIPDYERYLQHQREHHPEAQPLTEKEFYLACLKDRYESGKVNRCC